ncbi:hypothetical protein [Ferrovum myxofaciens]|uniref:hypothetical protein n=1 Tax=Ferrovum myxofaciens TaxID=416213 RepID=UPI00235772B4|nr:hypothetical protein [Ferrovum myxofaciens]MBU6995514.1 hypothetical protein [Ferrovum myxofaciens]
MFPQKYPVVETKDIPKVVVDVSEGGSCTEKPSRLSLILLLLILWLVTRPYEGILWDSEYYTVQALHFLWPDRYANDLYFVFGSQDQFSIFSRIYGPAIASLGLLRAHMVLTVLTQLFWVIGLTYLAKGIFQGRWVYLAMAGVIVFPGSAGLIFHYYSEPILTPRILAEALTLLALGAIWRERIFFSLGLLAVGTVIHPLMTLPGIVFWFLWFFGRQKTGWMACALAGTIVLGLAVSGVQPFVRLTQFFDPAWLNIVRQRSPYCFISQWGMGEWMAVIHTVLLTLWAMQKAGNKERPFLKLALLIGTGGVVLSWLGGDLLNNVLILDAQLWRAMWIVSLISHLFIAQRLSTLFHDPRGYHARWLWMSTFLLTLLAGFHGGYYFLATPLMAMAFLVQQWEERTPEPLPLWGRCLVASFFLLVFFRTAFFFWNTFILDTVRGEIEFVFALGALTLMYLSFKDSYAGFSTKSFSRIRFGMIGLLLLGTLMVWDQRSSWVKSIDEASGPPSNLSEILPQGRPIYWEGDVTVPWFLLRRSSYFSCSQGTGSLFSRETAINYWQRYRSFQPLHTVEFSEGNTYCAPLPGEKISGPPTQGQVEKVCRENPGLGGMVLLHSIEGMHPKIWNSPVLFTYRKFIGHSKRWVTTNRFYIYNCPIQK